MAEERRTNQELFRRHLVNEEYVKAGEVATNKISFIKNSLPSDMYSLIQGLLKKVYELEK